MRGKTAVALVAIMWVAQPADPYVSLLESYLTGNADTAVRRLLDMDSVSVSAGAHALPLRRDGRLLYAAAAIHTEAALLPRNDAGSLAAAYHLALARDVVQYGELHAKPRRDGVDLARSALPPLSPSFRRVWYIAALRHLESWARFAQAEPLLERARELYSRDADLMLLDAIADEAFANPRFATLSSSQRVKRLRDAERKLRSALDADPNAIETKLRYGRVLQQLGHPADARQILSGLPSSSDLRVRYLSSLFLGSIADQLGDQAGASQWYARAVDTVPGQSAVMARSELFHRAGDLDAAARALPAALEQSNQDPWWSYPFGQFWRVDEARAELRTLARQ